MSTARTCCDSQLQLSGRYSKMRRGGGNPADRLGASGADQIAPGRSASQVMNIAQGETQVDVNARFDTSKEPAFADSIVGSSPKYRLLRAGQCTIGIKRG